MPWENHAKQALNIAPRSALETKILLAREPVGQSAQRKRRCSKNKAELNRIREESYPGNAEAESAKKRIDTNLLLKALARE